MRRLGPGRRPLELPAVLDDVERVCALSEVDDAREQDDF